LLTRRPEAIDESLFVDRLRDAWQFRERIYPGREAYRLVHGEADGLPGLVIDRYGDVFVVASHTAGMDRLLPLVVSALGRVLAVRAIVLRNDAEARKLEDLPLLVEVLSGQILSPVTVQEQGATYEVDVVKGQKTGWFFDQAENRAVFSTFVEGCDVLDAFCYTGAWAISAARTGARSVVAVDSSPAALDIATRNLERNGVTTAQLIQANVFDLLPVWCREGRQFDVAVLDPPPFARSKKHISAAARGHRELHRRILRLLRPGGVLFTCSCSHHFGQDDMLLSVARGARDAHRRVRVLEIRGAARDHPVLPSTPETRYLICIIAQIDSG
jgi:23S rRNA (cytosine1962-C5)-methyltransferase